MKYLLQQKYYNTRWSNSFCGHWFGRPVWYHRLFHQEENVPVFLTLPNQFPWRTRASISARVPACSYSSPSKERTTLLPETETKKTPKPSYLTIFYFKCWCINSPYSIPVNFSPQPFFSQQKNGHGRGQTSWHQTSSRTLQQTQQKESMALHGIHGTGMFTVHLVDFYGESGDKYMDLLWEIKTTHHPCVRLHPRSIYSPPFSWSVKLKNSDAWGSPARFEQGPLIGVRAPLVQSFSNRFYIYSIFIVGTHEFLQCRWIYIYIHIYGQLNLILYIYTYAHVYLYQCVRKYRLQHRYVLLRVVTYMQSNKTL